MRNIISFEFFDKNGNSRIIEGVMPSSPVNLKSMTNTQTYDYFYNLVKKNPDSYIKELEEMASSSSPINTKQRKVDINALLVFAQSVKEGHPLGAKDAQEKEYMGKRFKQAIDIIGGLKGPGTTGSIKINGDKIK